MPLPESARLSETIKGRALALGFCGVGIAPAVALPAHQRAFRRYLSEGRHAGMAYLAQEPERREDPARLLPAAKSIISLAAAYYQGDHPPPPEVPAGRIARYAWGRDYHQPIETRLEALKALILDHAPGAAIRCAVDHAPILERAYAQEAGLGFIGKHGLLITPDHGSWVLLAELITDLDLEADVPAWTQCGSCTRCLDACPTGALAAPFQLDAGRCIAYVTIEHKGDAPDHVRPAIGDWLFGCDVCQEVCPYNRRVPERPGLEEFRPSSGVGPWLSLEGASTARSHGEFDRRFAGSPLRRVGRNGLRRNARVVGENLPTREPAPTSHD